MTLMDFSCALAGREARRPKEAAARAEQRKRTFGVFMAIGGGWVEKLGPATLAWFLQARLAVFEMIAGQTLGSLAVVGT